MKFFYVLLLCLTVILIHNYINLEVNKNVEEYYLNRKDKHFKLFDMGFRYLPDYSDKLRYVDFIYGVLVTIPVFFLRRGKFIKEYLGYLIIIFILRAITISVTVLPKDKSCDLDNRMQLKNNGLCYDKIFSGHTATLFLATLIYYKNGYINKPVLVILNVINVMILILAREHYTIDIVVAFLVSILVYQNKLIN